MHFCVLFAIERSVKKQISRRKLKFENAPGSGVLTIAFKDFGVDRQVKMRLSAANKVVITEYYLLRIF